MEIFYIVISFDSFRNMASFARNTRWTSTSLSCSARLKENKFCVVDSAARKIVEYIDKVKPKGTRIIKCGDVRISPCDLKEKILKEIEK